jgi:hypothetical protein
MITPEERVKTAWGKVTFGSGWSDRLNALLADEIRADREAFILAIREECPTCDNGVAGWNQLTQHDWEPEECQYCGELMKAIRKRWEQSDITNDTP